MPKSANWIAVAAANVLSILILTGSQAMAGTPPDQRTHDPQTTHSTPAALRPLLSVHPGKGPILIAIDPGHGGIDPGTHGPHGLDEKVVTLAVGKMVAQKIDATPGLRAFLTRTRNVYVSLRRRVLEAQEHHAALFISIHVNSFPRAPGIAGGAVYALSEHGASDAEAALVAREENAADPTIGTIHFAPHNKMINSTLTQMAQRASIANAGLLGTDVLKYLGRYEPLYEHHVQYANFEVLRDPVIPSILIETAFLSNPRQARELHTLGFREHLATAIYDGIRAYLRQHNLRPMRVVRDNRPGAPHYAYVKHRMPRATLQKSGTYRVRSGNTLSGVALRLHISQWRLKVFNHLHGNRLRIGQTLRIPPPSFRYRVKPGDSLSIIAARANVGTHELKAYNDLDGSSLKIGQILLLPPAGSH